MQQVEMSAHVYLPKYQDMVIANDPLGIWPRYLTH